MSKQTISSSNSALLFLLLLNSACALSPTQYIAKGNTAFDSGHYAEADINYEKAIQKDSGSGEAYYRLGLSKFKEGNLVPSYRALSRAAELLPNRDDVATALGDTSFAAYLGNRASESLYQQVTHISEGLLQKNPKSYDGLRLKGYVLMLDKRFPEAAEVLKQANSIKSMQPDLIDALVQCLIRSDDFQEGEKLARTLIQQQPAHSQIYDLLYGYYLEHNHPADGEGILKNKVSNNPDVVQYRLQLAAHYASAKNESAFSQTLQEVRDNPMRFPTGRLQVGELLYGMKRYDEALQDFQASAKEGGPRKLDAQKRVVQTLIAQHKPEQALAVIEDMLKQKPDSEDARALRAGINLDSGQPDKLDSALSELRALVKDTPGDPMLHYNFGRAYLGKGENDSALSEFQQAIKLDPSFLAPQLLAANLSMERQDYRQASQYADQILKLTHDNAAARLLKAASMTGLGNFNEAASELRRLDREYPGAAAPKLQIGNLKLAEKSYKEAETIFRGLYESDRSNLVALSRLIDTYYEQGRYDLAVQYLTKETRTSTSPEVRAMLGEAALRGKKLDVAVQEYSQLASADPKSAVNHLRLGDAYLQKGSIKEAIDQFQIARSLSPKDPLVSAMLALSFHNAGRVEDAQQAYRSTLALQSGNPVVKNNLAYLTADSGGNLKEALQLAQDASRQLPASVPVSDTLGWIYVKMKMTDSALQMLSNVVQKAPEEPIYRYHLAAALYDKGAMSEAKKNLLIAMSNQPLRAYEVKIKELLAKIPN